MQPCHSSQAHKRALRRGTSSGFGPKLLFALIQRSSDLFSPYLSLTPLKYVTGRPHGGPLDLLHLHTQYVVHVDRI
jgi:hypothetical protein